MKNDHHIKASALPAVIAVSALILLTIFILSSLFYSATFYKWHINAQWNRWEDIESGFKLYCREPSINNSHYIGTSFQLYDDSSESVINIDVKPWGMYRKVRISSKDGSPVSVRILGNAQAYKYSCSLYYPNCENPLSITGCTTLDGRIFIPQNGIMRKRIKWEQFSGQGVIGETSKSDNGTLPMPDKEMLDYIDSLYFNSPDRVIISPYDTIACHSLIVANTIIVEAGTSITAQLMAKDTLIIEDNVIMGYPSGIYLRGENNKRYMEVGEWSIVNGYAIVNGTDYGQNRDVHYMQKKNSAIRGLVYVNGNAECRGAVCGTIMMNNSVVSVNDETYNHTLYDFTLLPNSDIAFPFWVESDNVLKEIVCLD